MSLQLTTDGGVNQPSRRTVIKGAAWSVPVVAVAASVPYAAATANTPCVPPQIPLSQEWEDSGWLVHQWTDGVAYVDTQKTDDTGHAYVTCFADSDYFVPDGNGNPTSTVNTENGYAWGYTSLGALGAGTYLFNFKIRANYGTQTHTNGGPNPSHDNSFAAGVQGFIENLRTGQKIAVTDFFTTRAAQLNGTQIPNVYDTFPSEQTKPGEGPQGGVIDSIKSMYNQPWLYDQVVDGGQHASFSIPDNGFTDEWRFTWEFTEYNRSTKRWQTNRPSGQEETMNDDIDVTYPEFVASDCLP